MKGHVIEVDFTNTKKAVDECMKLYKYYLLSITDCPLQFKDNKIQVVLDSYDDQFIREKSRLAEKREYVGWVSKNINKLEEIHRKILIHSYFYHENDDLIANDIGYTRCYFYTLKKEAIIHLAYALNIEVTKKE